jgi:hypothetical protein
MNNANASDFERFEFLLRLEFHDLVHCVIDGTMCTLDSASAPEFFLHHGFVDKIWWDWQRLNRTHKFNEYFLTQRQRMPAIVYRSEDFLDLNNQPGCVCAEYVPSRSRMYTTLQGREFFTMAYTQGSAHARVLFLRRNGKRAFKFEAHLGTLSQF